MEKQTQVVDASVVVKWFTEETDSEKARHLQELHVKREIVLAIPSILFAEVLNALKFKNNKESDLNKANEALWKNQFKIQPTNESLFLKAIENSSKYNLTIYDALYVATAQLNGAPLITADSALFNIPNVVSLEKI